MTATRTVDWCAMPSCKSDLLLCSVSMSFVYISLAKVDGCASVPDVT